MSEALKPCPVSELEPCPFPSCGSHVVCYDGLEFGGPGAWVVCEVCGSQGPWANTQAEAAALWNAAPRPSSHPPVADRIRAVADDVTDHRWRNTLRKLADDVEGEGEECGP